MQHAHSLEQQTLFPKSLFSNANQEALSNAINSFEKLFPEKYKTIEIAKQEAKIAKENSKAFNTVKKRELIESTLKNQTQVKQAEKEIEELEKEMSLIINEPLSTFLNANQKAVTQFATINAELKALKAKRNRLKSKIEGLNFSFSGLKTAVINLHHKNPEVNKVDFAQTRAKTKKYGYHFSFKLATKSNGNITIIGSPIIR